MRSQLGLVMALRHAWSDVNAGIDEITSTFKETQEALTNVSEEFTEATAAGSKMTDTIARGLYRTHKATSAFHKAWDLFTVRFPKTGAFVMGFIDGITEGFAFATNVLTQLVKITGSVTKAFWDIGSAIAAMPFKSLSAFIELSNKLVPLMEAVARATEEVRKQFGDLSRTAGADIITTAQSIGNEFTNIGLNGYAIFGSLDERLQAVNKLFTDLGANVDNFREEIRDSNGMIMLLQKGLGLTEEVMGSLAKRAKAMGTTLTTQLKDITKFSVAFSKKFDVSQKLISRDIGTMIADVKNFGNMSPKELAKVSVYARKLGVDVKELLGVIEKFDTFESAAEGAAQLAQAFGAQADAIGLMKAESPADRIEELRRAFLSTGKSADMMTRQELKLLSQTTGLSEEISRAVFSQKNFGKSLKDLENEGVNVASQTLTVEEAVMSLKDSIERIIKPFKQFSGFLQAFADGFARGIFNAKDFRDLLTKLHSSLRATYEIGMSVGATFKEMFPGVKQIIASLSDLFNSEKPSMFRTLLLDVAMAFRQLFASIKDGPDAVKTFFWDMEAAFDDFFATVEGGPFETGAKNFANAAGNMMAGMLTVVSEGALKIIQVLTDVFSGKQKIEIPGSAAGKGIAFAFIDPIIKELSDKNGAITKIIPAFLELLSTIWEKYKEPITNTLRPIASGIALAMFGSAFSKAVLAAVMTGLSQAFTTWLMTGGGDATMTTTLSGIGTKIVGIITSPFLLIPAAIAAAIGSSIGVSNGIDKFNDNLQKKFSETDSLVGAAAAGIADTLTFGLIPDGLLQKFSEFMASLSETTFNFIRTLPMGDAIAASLMGFVESLIHVTDSIGDMFKALFDGDSKKFSDAAISLGEQVVNLMADTLTAVVTLIPSALSLAAALMYKGAKLLLSGIVSLALWAVEQIFSILSGITGIVTGILKRIATVLKDVPVFGAIAEGAAFAAEAIAWLFSAISNQLEDWRKSWSEFDFEKTFMSLYDGLTSVLNKAWTEVKSWPSKFIDIGGQIVEGFISGLSSVGSKVKDTFGDALTAIKDVFSIRSPSKEMVSIGEYMLDGLQKGLKEMPSLFSVITSDSFDTLIEKFKSFDSAVSASFRSLPSALADGSPAIRAIRKMVEEVDAIENTLDILKMPLDIDAKLEMIGKELGLKDKEFRVERKNLQINMNVNITVEAEKLAKVMSEHGIVSTERPIR